MPIKRSEIERAGGLELGLERVIHVRCRECRAVLPIVNRTVKSSSGEVYWEQDCSVYAGHRCVYQRAASDA